MTNLLIQYWPATTFASDIYGLKWFISGEWRFGFRLNGIRDEEDGSGWSCEGVAIRWQNHPVPRGRMLLYISHQIVKWSICSAPPSQVRRCPCLSYWVVDWTSPYKVVESLSRCKSCVPCRSLHPLCLHPASSVSSRAVIAAIRFHSSHKIVPYLKLFHLNSGHESFFRNISILSKKAASENNVVRMKIVEISFMFLLRYDPTLYVERRLRYDRSKLSDRPRFNVVGKFAQKDLRF